MFRLWEIVVSAVAITSATFLTHPLLSSLLSAIRARVGKSFQWLGDVQRYVLVSFSWLLITLVWRFSLLNIIGLAKYDIAVDCMNFVSAVPLVIATFAMRRVITNVLVRRFEWDRDASDYDVRIFILTETTTFFCLVAIVIEIFYIFFASSEIASFILFDLLLSIEFLALVGGYTMLKNMGIGLFLMFAEPFRTGSFCCVQGMAGYIDKVSLPRTVMRRRDGSRVYIPNGIFADSYQVTRDEADTYTCNFLIRVDPSTPADSLQRLVEKLQIDLLEIAESVPASAVSTSGVSASEAMTTPRSIRASNYSFLSHAETLPEEKTLRVYLFSMYTIKVAVSLDKDKFTSVEEAKTEMNFIIIKVMETLQIQSSAAYA